MLAAGARAQRRADRAGADPPEPAAACAPRPATRISAPRGAYELAPAERRAPRRRSSPPAPRSRSRSRAQKLLAGQGIAARVVSMPSLELFSPSRNAGPPHGSSAMRRSVAVEAAVALRLGALIGPDGIFVGMTGFGASAPDKDLYKHFGITAEAVAERSQSACSERMKPHAEGARHDGQGRDQRLRPHRPQRPARDRRERPQGHRGGRDQRPRPGRDQRPPAHATTACTAASRARSRSRATRSIVDGKRDQGDRRAATRPKLPHKELGVDIALECTGIFTDQRQGGGASRRRRQARARSRPRPRAPT